MESRNINFNLHKLFKAPSTLGEKVKGLTKRDLLNKFNFKSIQAVKKKFNINNNENAYKALTGAYVKIENEANQRKALKSKLNREFNVKQQKKPKRQLVRR